MILAAVLVFAARRRHRMPLRRGTTGRWQTRPEQPRLGVIGLVAAREVRERLRGRAFRVATLLLLAGVIAAVVIPAAIHHSSRPQRVGVVGALSATERSGIVADARGTGADVEFVGEPDAAAADEALRAKRVDLVVVDGNAVVVRTALTGDDTSTTAQLARATARTLGVARAVEAAGLSPAQVAALGAAASVPVRGLQAAKPRSTSRGASITTAVLVFVLLSQYLTWTLIGVIQEKANRVVEVLLATVRPIQLLTGKLLGIGSVVFAQAALLAALAFGVGRAVGSDLLRGAAPWAAVSQLLWLMLGYAFYSWLYAAAGSMVERQDEVQSLAIPLAVPLVFGYVIAISSLGSGHASTLVHVLAYLPPTAPFAMPVLVSLREVSWWQFVLSVAISLACTFATARFAAAVYRRAILRTGRRVRLRELLRPTN